MSLGATAGQHAANLDMAKRVHGQSSANLIVTAPFSAATLNLVYPPGFRLV